MADNLPIEVDGIVGATALENLIRNLVGDADGTPRPAPELGASLINASHVNAKSLEVSGESLFLSKVLLLNGFKTYRRITVAAPGGGLTTKTVKFGDGGGTFPISFEMPDEQYIVLVEPHGNCIVWVTAKTKTEFVLNYSVAGGVEVMLDVIG